MTQILLKSPWKIKVSDKKYFTPTINQYRNAHYFTLSKAKRLYSEVISKQLDGIDITFNEVSVTFIPYPPSKRRVDPDNLVIHLKFAMDAVVGAGILEDDHYGIVRSLNFKFGEIDREQPRVDILLEEYSSD